MTKLKYEKYNNSNNVITIDLHNGYSVIAVSGYSVEKELYTTTLLLKANSIVAQLSRQKSKIFIMN